MSLEDLQNRLSESILLNNIEPIKKSISLEEKKIETRLKIYQTNFILSLTDSLRAIYPVVERLVGKEFFIFLSKSYIKKHPPKKPNLNIYGNQMSDFISNFAECKNVPYLSDISKLEWARHIAYFSKEVESISIKALEKIPKKNLEEITLTIHPSATLIKSKFPVFHIWELNQKENSNFSDVNINENEYGIVIRNNNNVINYRLNFYEFEWLTLISRKENIKYASLKIYKPNTYFKLEKSLSNLFSIGTFINLRLKT